MYLYGYGTDKNEKYAYLLYERARDRCLETDEDGVCIADVQLRVGRCLLRGTGVKTDAERAHMLLSFALMNFYKRRNTDKYVLKSIENTKSLIAEAQELLDREVSDYQ